MRISFAAVVVAVALLAVRQSCRDADQDYCYHKHTMSSPTSVAGYHRYSPTQTKTELSYHKRSSPQQVSVAGYHRIPSIATGDKIA